MFLCNFMYNALYHSQCAMPCTVHNVISPYHSQNLVMLQYQQQLPHSSNNLLLFHKMRWLRKRRVGLRPKAAIYCAGLRTLGRQNLYGNFLCYLIIYLFWNNVYFLFLWRVDWFVCLCWLAACAANYHRWLLYRVNLSGKWSAKHTKSTKQWTTHFVRFCICLTKLKDIEMTVWCAP